MACAIDPIWPLNMPVSLQCTSLHHVPHSNFLIFDAIWLHFGGVWIKPNFMLIDLVDPFSWILNCPSF
jgi:hypothetical protein